MAADDAERPGRVAALMSRFSGTRRPPALNNRIAPEDVTIVVLNWKRAQETIRCLESLAAANLRGASVLVVDNGSRDGSVETILQRFPEQAIVTLPVNRGYSGGNNAGIHAAIENGAKAVLLLNNDTQVAADFLDPLLWVLNGDVKAAAASSAVLRADVPELLESAYLEIYWGHGIIRHYGVNKLPGEGFDYVREVEVVVGCSVLLSVDAVKAIGPLDESYFAYHEEVDWCFRARRAGYRVYWHPYSRVWHNKSTSTSALGPAVSGERARASGPQLPATVPLTWNPVQTYLGARNAVRFVRLHASLPRKIYFVLSSLYGVPLEFLAAVLRQEQALKIGAWSYRKAVSLYCSNPDGLEDAPPAALWRKLLNVPYALLRAFPRDIRSARREGRLAQLGEHVSGLWDGILDRPLPLERLGLR
jgi:GT2 family glycosyltransferase